MKEYITVKLASYKIAIADKDILDMNITIGKFVAEGWKLKQIVTCPGIGGIGSTTNILGVFKKEQEEDDD